MTNLFRGLIPIRRPTTAESTIGNLPPRPLSPPNSVKSAYPVHALTPMLRAGVEAVTAIAQAPAALAANSALTSAALVAQKQVDVRQLNQSTSPVSLFLLTIAESGERKTTVDGHLNSPLHDLDDIEFHRYSDEYSQYQVDLARGRPAVPPTLDLFLHRDPTLEGLLKIYLSGCTATGLVNDEGGGFFGSHAMNRDNRTKTVAAFCSLWDGSPFSRPRASGGFERVSGCRLSVHLQIQPLFLKSLLEDNLLVQQGFLGRTLISFPESTIGSRLFQDAAVRQRRELQTFHERLRQLAALPLPLKTRNGRSVVDRRVIELSPEARELFIAYFNECELCQREGELYDCMRSAASKLTHNAIRVAAVLEFFEDPTAPLIGGATAAAAIAIVRYHAEEFRALVTTDAARKRFENAKALLDWLIARPDLAEFYKEPVLKNGPRELRSAAALNEAIKVLGKRPANAPRAVRRGPPLRACE